MRTRVIALGQAAAGDDGVGFAVLEELHRREIPPDVELLRANDATDLMWLLPASANVVLVDAALGPSAGRVMVLDIASLARAGVQPVSSHGIGVREVVELARLLSPERLGDSIRIVAIGIALPQRPVAQRVSGDHARSRPRSRACRRIEGRAGAPLRVIQIPTAAWTSCHRGQAPGTKLTRAGVPATTCDGNHSCAFTHVLAPSCSARRSPSP